MRVAIIATGTRGDVQPLLALGVGLRLAGHQVRFATEAGNAHAVAEAGLQYQAMTGDSKGFHSGRLGVNYREKFTSLRAVVSHDRFRKSFVASMWIEGMRRHLREAEAACDEADVLLCQPWSGIGPSLGERFQIPAIVAAAFPVPQLPTEEFPCPWNDAVTPDMSSDENRRSWDVWPQIWRSGMCPLVQEWRRDVLGLSEQSPEVGIEQIQIAPHILGYSPFVLPKPIEWGQSVLVTGFWFLESRAEYQPSPELQEFLEHGEPPVVVGFSSQVGSNQELLIKLVVRALTQAGVRGLLVEGWGTFDRSGLPDTVISVREIPYSWLLPRAKALVHHGGAGTMGIAMRAGIPQVIATFGWDQAFWGHRSAKLGVSPPPLEAKSVTAEQLAQAVRHVTTNEVVRRRVELARDSVSREHGIEIAVRAIERLAA